MKIIRLFKRNKDEDSSDNTDKSTVRGCDCESELECPFNAANDCELNKSNCHLLPKNKAVDKKNESKLIIISILGLFFYFLFSVLSNDNECVFPYSSIVYNILLAISLSLIAGTIVAFIVDIPTRLKEYEDSFINALSSNRYIKRLDENRLTELRKEITAQLHKKDVPFMAKGLIDMDELICDLLRKPYYSRYRHSILCSKTDDQPDFIKKEHVVEYKLINPYGSNKTAKTFISFTTLIMMNEGVNEEDYIKSLNLSATCIIDNTNEIDISDEIIFDFLDLDNDEEFYNKKIIVKAKKQNISDRFNGLRIDFNDNIKVRMHYTMFVNKNDVCFTERLRYPVKNFRLDYSHRDKNVKLHGQIFGTGVKQSDISIRYIDNNNISLETFDWLLPDNGVIVVS